MKKVVSLVLSAAMVAGMAISVSAFASGTQRSAGDATDSTWDYPYHKTTATAPSQCGTGNGNDGPASYALDGNEATHWHSNYDGANGGTGPTDLTGNNANQRYIQLTLDEAVQLKGLRYKPRVNGGANAGGANGTVTEYEIKVSTTGGNNDEEWTSVVTGTWENNDAWKLAEFTTENPVKYVRLYGTTTAGASSNTFMNCAELRVQTTQEQEENIFLNKTASASSENTDLSGHKEQASYANDGSTDTKWCADWNGNTNPADHNLVEEWWQVDLGDRYTVEELNVIFDAASNWQYYVAVSDDATFAHITEIAAKDITTLSNAAEATITVGQTGRYVRFYLMPGARGVWPCLREVSGTGTVVTTPEVTKEELQALVDEAEDKHGEWYTDGWEEYAQAIEAAKEVLAGNAPTADALANAKQAIETAKEGLVERDQYTEEDRFVFPSQQDVTATLEAEFGELHDVKLDSDGQWYLQVATGSWASHGEYLNCFNQQDTVTYYYNAPVAGTYSVTATYRSGSTANKLAWSGDKIQSGNVAAGAEVDNEQGQTRTVTFDLVVTQAGAGTLEFTGPDTKSPQLDKLEITLTEAAYSVTVNPATGGTAQADVTTAAAGDTVTLTATPATGYHFVRWESEDVNIGENNTFEMPEKAVSITPVFAKNTYTVTINNPAEGGELTGAATVIHGESLELTITPDAGYHLESLTVNGQVVEVTGDTYTVENVTGAVTVTPVFAKNTYTVTINTAENGSVTGASQVTHGEDLVLTITPAEGYHLESLTVNDQVVEVTGDTYTVANVTGAVTVTPVFAKNTYTVTINTAENGSVTGAAQVTHGENLVLTITPDEGYHLESLTVNGQVVEVTGDTYTVANVTGAVTVTPVFAKNTYTVTINTAENGSVTGAAQVTHGENLVLTITPDEGYHLESLTVNGQVVEVTGDTYTVANVTGAVTVTPVFAKNTYTVTINTAENGSVTGAAQVTHGEDLVLTITPDAGYHLESLTVNGQVVEVTGDTYTVENVTGAVTVTPVFAKNTYTVTINTAENGSVTGASQVTHGEDLVLTITPAEGYHLESLTVNDQVVEVTGDTYTVANVTGAVTVTPVFAKNTYTVTINTAENGSVTGAAQVTHGENLVLTITPDEGYHLESLTVNGQVVEVTGNTYTVENVTGAVTVTPVFAKNTYTVTINTAENGSVTGAAQVTHGEDLVLTIAPAEGYHLESLTVNGQVVEVTGDTYTVANVTENVTVNAVFEAHTTQLEGKVEATCTTDGYTGDLVCTVCGTVVEEGETIKATGHTQETIPGKEATCTQDGLTDGVKCTVCGEILVEQEVIKATGHTQETIPGKEATCTQDGLTDGVKCTVCGEILVEQEVIKATGHTQETIPGKEATCTQDGLTDGVKCTVCGTVVEEGETIKATGHTQETIPGKEATCTQDGLTDGVKCSVCGEILVEQEVIKATGHKFEDGVCTVCGEKDPNYVPPTQEPQGDVVLDNQTGDQITAGNADEVFEANTIITVVRVEDGETYTAVEQALKGVVADMKHTAILDITATLNGKPVQPSAPVQMTFAIPQHLSADNLKLFYVSDDGKTTQEIPITVDKDARTVTATIAHFSTYVLANVVVDETTGTVPPTGDASQLMLMTGMLLTSAAALGGLVVASRKRRG